MGRLCRNLKIEKNNDKINVFLNNIPLCLLFFVPNAAIPKRVVLLPLEIQMAALRTKNVHSVLKIVLDQVPENLVFATISK